MNIQIQPTLLALCLLISAPLAQGQNNTAWPRPATPKSSATNTVKIPPAAPATVEIQMQPLAASHNSAQLDQVSQLRREIDLLKQELLKLRREINQHYHELPMTAVSVHEFESNKAQYARQYLLLLPAGRGSTAPRTRHPVQRFAE